MKKRPLENESDYYCIVRKVGSHKISVHVDDEFSDDHWWTWTMSVEAAQKLVKSLEDAIAAVDGLCTCGDEDRWTD